MKDLTLVVEAKGYSRPVRGDINGKWQVRSASGQWKDIDNPYLQALSAKNALRDAMRTFAGQEVQYYPAATVVLVPEIPQGSAITSGDFKVSIIGLTNLRAEIQKKQTECWDLDKWRAFAQAQRLITVSSVDAACDPALFEAEVLVNRYGDEFRKTYYPYAAEFINCQCNVKGEEWGSAKVVEQICAGGAELLLKGPSGCGKSLLAIHAAVSFLNSGGLPIVLSAKNYQKKLKDVLSQEVGLLANCGGAELFRAARRLGRRTMLIVDGYNECASDRSINLTRSIAAVARMYETELLVTSQAPLERSDLLSLGEIVVPEPNREMKLDIARAAAGGRSISMSAETLLDSVTTGLEAALIGKAGLEIGAESSRYRLFDTFVRKRLNGVVTEGIRALSRVAGWMAERVTFSLSVRDLDRLLATEQTPSSLTAQLYGNRLLVRRGDRVSFGHELFLNAFAAEWIIRQAAGDSKQILAALRTPRHADRKEMILGAIDDDSLLREVLDQLSDPAALDLCLSGVCGSPAREWVEARYPNLLGRMELEIGRVTFHIASGDHPYVEIDPHGLTMWSLQEQALIDCLPSLLTQGVYLREMLALTKAMDTKISDETARLREEIKEKKVPLRPHMFWMIYVSRSEYAPALGRVFAQLHGGLFDRRKCKGLAKEIQNGMDSVFLSPGQIHLLAILARWGENSDPLVARFITWAIQNHWQVAPGHLRQQLVDTAGYCWDLEEPIRSELVSAVESCLDNRNPLFNSLVFDVLQRLGAFESQEEDQTELVSQQLDRLLSSPDDEESCREVHGIYYAQFDHPYSMAYYEAISRLSEQQRNIFLIMAARGARDRDLFLAPLLTELANTSDDRAGTIVRDWATLPPRDSFMPQEAVAVFVVAHIALARLGRELPQIDVPAGDPAASALVACGVILYWMNRLDMSEEDRRAACKVAWSSLSEHADNGTLNAIRECAEVRVNEARELPGGEATQTSLAHYFPAETLQVCRRALEHPDDQTSYFPRTPMHDRARDLGFAIGILGSQGMAMDFGVLRRYSEDPDVGQIAIRAIRNLEERLGLT